MSGAPEPPFSPIHYPLTVLLLRTHNRALHPKTLCTASVCERACSVWPYLYLVFLNTEARKQIVWLGCVW